MTKAKRKGVRGKYQEKERILEQYRRTFRNLNRFKSLSSGDQHRRKGSRHSEPVVMKRNTTNPLNVIKIPERTREQFSYSMQNGVSPILCELQQMGLFKMMTVLILINIALDSPNSQI